MYRYKIPALFLVAVCLAGGRLQAQIASFPGALGFGGTTSGAATVSVSGTSHSGGTLYHVTNLNDTGAGSFRDAVSAGGRVIVFDVGGNIRLHSAVSAQGNLTIAGQTAPGGIQIYGAETSFYGQSNIICRYVHFRDGTLDPNYPGSSSVNSHTNAVSLGNTTNVIMDHCSFEFAAYNNVDSVGAVNITFQNCIFADPIAEQRFNCHFETGPVTFIGNLWANAHGRSPLGKANMQFIDNVVYNYGYAIDTGNSSGVFTWDILNNLFIAGPSTSSPGDAYYQIDSNQSAYATGNYLDSTKNGALGASPDNTVNGATVLNSPWNAASQSLATLTATGAYYSVVSNAGPLPRDPVDGQVVGNVLSLGTAGMLWTSQVSTGLSGSGYGVIVGSVPLPDSDASGMPDDWKSAMGLSQTNPSVGGLTSSTGYTNLENYLNWEAQPNTWVAKNTVGQPTSVTIDLSQYANGFAVGSTYVVSGTVNGTVTQSGSGGYLATFVPKLNTSGLGGFNWSVTNGIATMSSTCGVLISVSGPSQSVRWKGNGTSNNWDLSTANWTAVSTGGTTDFGTGDPVTFDDTGSVSPAVNIGSAVSPGSMTFNTYSNAYTLSGAGSIGGTGVLIKEGAAALTLKNSGANTYNGGAILNSGTTYDYYSSSLGTGPISLNGGTLNLIATSSNFITISPGTNVNVASTLGVQGSNIYLTGSFNGSAPLTVNFNGNIVCTPEGSWSGFSGQLNLANAGTFRLENAGFPNSIVNCEGAEYLTDDVSGATTVYLGALEGVSSANLTGGGPAGSSVLYNIGALNTPSAFAGTISNGGTQTVGITQAGNSTLTLSGDNTYTGATSVSSGTLLLTGTLGNTPVTIASGANFVSNTSVGGSVAVNAGGSVYPGTSTGNGNIGTLTIANGFTVAGGSTYATGANLYYSLSSSPTATGSNDLITVTSGTLNMSGTVNFNISLGNGTLGAGTYPLINGNSVMQVPGGTNPGLVLNLPIPTGGVTRQTFAMGRQSSNTSPGYINLTVTNNPGALTWTGSNGATWDMNTTADWSGASPATFYDMDTVTFNDTNAGGTVNLSGTLAPNVAYVTNNVTNYTFNGSGGLAGNSILIKSGTASLSINNTGNTFTGPTYLNAGALYANTNAALGTGTIYLNGGTLYLPTFSEGSLPNSILVDVTSTIVNGSDSFFLTGAGATLSSTSAVTLNFAFPTGGNISTTLTMDGGMSGFQGTIELGAGSGALRLDNGGSALALFDLGTGTALLGNRDGGITDNFGAVQGGPGTTLSGRTSGSGNTASTYVVGALNTNTTFAGAIVNNGDMGGLNIIKTGAGNWTLSGTSIFTGDIYVQQGTLTISGSDNNGGLDFETETGAALNLAGGTISTETVQIDQGAFFNGNGVINGNLVSEGTNSVTNTAGTVNVTGLLTVNGNVENDGTMTLSSGAILYTPLAAYGGSTFVNNGVLDLRNSPQTWLPVGYVNNGTILTSSSLITIQALTWVGDGATNAWNSSAANWTSAITGSFAAFSVDDPVTFTDGGSTSPAVNITGVVSPSSIEISGNASNYTFAGTGSIGGSGGLEDDNTGSLTLSSSNTFAGPTLLNSGTLQAVANSSNTASGISAALSLSSALTLAGNTTLALLGNSSALFEPASVTESGAGPYNFYVSNSGSGTGNTMILGNVGQFGPPATSPTFNLSGANGYTLQLGSNSAGTAALSYYNNTVLNSNTPGVTLSIPGGIANNYPLSYTLTFEGAGNISIGSIVPYSSTYTPVPAFVGTGIVTLAGSNTYTAATTVTSGQVQVTGQITATPTVTVGSVAGAAAALYQSGTGSLIANTSGAGGAFQIGSIAGAFGYFNLSAGSFDPAGEIDVAGFNGGAATFGEFDMSGGTVNLPNSTGTYFLSNRGLAGETSVVNISGGTVQILGGGLPAAGAFNGLAVNWSQTGVAQVATITISGSGQVLTPSLTVKLNNGGNTTAINGGAFNGISGNSANVANLNLNSGGLLQTLGFLNGASNNANVSVNFNGGTLEAGNVGNSAYLSNLGGVYIYGGGGTFNNNGQAITIAQPLLAVTGSGVTSVALSATGSGYTVPPAISFSGGGGTGATGYAAINPTTGVITGIVITNPGTGYGSAPAVTLTGTTAGTPAVLGPVSMVPNATTGGMTFTGAGNTTLTAVETYTGPTVVNTGTLTIANSTNAAVSGLGASSGITINNGATISVSAASDNALLGSVSSSTAVLTINTGGTLTASDSSHLEKLALAGGTLAENGSPTADQIIWGVYNLDRGVTAGGTSATSIISAQDVGLTQSGGTVFNVSPGAANGIDLDVTGGFAHLSSEGNDNGLVKTGNGVMVLAGTSNYLSATTVSAGVLGVSGSLATTNVTVSGSATLALGGGTITTGTVQIGAQAYLTGFGAINGTLINQGTAMLSGSLLVNGNFQNNGSILVTSSGSLNLSGNHTFVNNGLLDIMDSLRTSLPAGFVNNGTILTSALVVVQQLSKSANTFSATIQSYSAHTYQLEKCADLVSWQPVGASQAGTGSALVLTDTNATSTSMFYRIGVEP